jgi:hypothetical protein
VELKKLKVEKELKEITEALNAKMVEFEKNVTATQEMLEGKIDSVKYDELKSANESLGADIVKLNGEFEKYQLSQKNRKG